MSAADALLPAALLAAAVLVAGGASRTGTQRLAAAVTAPARALPARRGPSPGRLPRDQLSRGRLPAAGPDRLDRSERRLSLEHLPGRGLLLVVAPPVGLVLGGPGLAVLALVSVLVGRRALRHHRSRRARAGERSRAVEACTALAAELRAGRAPAEALEVAAGLATGGTGRTLSTAAATARLGGDVPEALLRRGDSAVPELLRGLAACWQVCARSGSGLAPAVERLADGLRTRQAQERAVDAALAGPRATAGLLAVLPLAGLALAAGLGAHPVHVLLRTPLGLVCLLLGTALDLLGVWWTGRLVASVAGDQ